MGSEPTGVTDSAREDRDYVAEVERGERVARWGLAVSGVVAALIAGAVMLAAVLVLVVTVGGVLVFVDR
ncbi:hypothetical protein [Kitasatospora sp. MBT63]|uniref:hypothetical protein n=1 Tax=Kitasatospora sp. MBT63 TaxID=1444768 RepID=UPI0011EA6A0B|nr:hypothetical protein [Kitasatospora sp. MBT63]